LYFSARNVERFEPIRRDDGTIHEGAVEKHRTFKLWETKLGAPVDKALAEMRNVICWVRMIAISTRKDNLQKLFDDPNAMDDQESASDLVLATLAKNWVATTTKLVQLFMPVLKDLWENVGQTLIDCEFVTEQSTKDIAKHLNVINGLFGFEQTPGG